MARDSTVAEDAVIPPRTSLTSRRFLMWLAILLLMGDVLYTAGLDYGRPLPEYSPSTVQKAWLNKETVFHPDAFAYVGLGYQMLLKHTLNPRYFENPSLNIYTDMLVFWLSGVVGLPHNISYGTRETAPFSLYVMGEYLSALFGLLAVALAFAAGKVAFNRPVGLLAAALTAFSPLTVQHAHYATPNAETLAVSTGALFIAFVIFKQRRPTLMVYVLGGLLVGLTAAARYNAVLVGVVTILAIAAGWWRHHRIAPVALGLAAIPIGLIIGTPGALFAFPKFIEDVRYILNWYKVVGGGPGWTSNYGLVYHWRYTLMIVVGPVAALGALLGLSVMMAQWRKAHGKRTAWFGGALFLYLVIYSLTALPGTRLNANLLLPLIVPMSLLAAYGLVWVWARSGRRRWMMVALSGLLLGWPAHLSLRFAQLIATPDNRLRAQAWVYQHIPKGTDVHLLGSYNVPLDPLDYPTEQTYSVAVKPDNPLWNSAVIIYSDATQYAILRDSALTPNPVDYQQAVETSRKLKTEWMELTRFPRMFWPGQDLPPDDVSVWHQMEIVVYCNPAKCPVKQPASQVSN
jgi:hypothetical protein